MRQDGRERRVYMGVDETRHYHPVLKASVDGAAAQPQYRFHILEAANRNNPTFLHRHRGGFGQAGSMVRMRAAV